MGSFFGNLSQKFDNFMDGVDHRVDSAVDWVDTKVAPTLNSSIDKPGDYVDKKCDQVDYFLDHDPWGHVKDSISKSLHFGSLTDTIYNGFHSIAGGAASPH